MPHNHIQVEILLVLNRGMTASAGGDDFALGEGDALVINPFEVHSAALADSVGCEYLCLTFSAKHFGFFSDSVLCGTADEIDSSEYCFDSFYPAKSHAGRVIGRYMIRMSECFYLKTRASECEMLSCFYGLMSVLFSGHYHPDRKQLPKNADFIKSVQNVIIEKYKEPLTTSDVSGDMYMTSSRFCQLFRKNFGCSFLSYLSRYRILKSKEYLGQKMTVAEIASAVGFSDYCHFSKSFRKIVGIPPSVFFGKRKRD